MTIVDVPSFAAGQWIAPDSSARPIENAITGQIMAQAGCATLETDAMLAYARDTGGPALRAMTFHQRARMIKALALHLDAHKQRLYDCSFSTGATQRDHLIDVDGGIGTMFVYASKGRREMPDAQIYVDGAVEQLGRSGSFAGQHICTPLQGVAVHINAFNFPVWGMLEKLAPALIAGVPAIVKPATATCYVTETAVRLMLDSGILPPGALQLVSGGLGTMLNHLSSQDVVSFTGSADTALHLRALPN
ncbi:MAG: aldehyde dehydrogenase family protein, partial [Paracoccaceae bacterium]